MSKSTKNVKSSKKGNHTTANSQNKMTSPQELVEFNLKQNELRQIIHELHQPLLYIGLSLFILPKVFIQLKHLLGLKSIEDILLPYVQESADRVMKERAGDVWEELWKELPKESKLFEGYTPQISPEQAGEHVLEYLRKTTILKYFEENVVGKVATRFDYIATALASLISIRASQNTLFKYIPLGIFTKIYKRQEHLLNPQPHQLINKQELQQNTKALEVIIKDLKPWQTRIRLGMRVFLGFCLSILILNWFFGIIFFKERNVEFDVLFGSLLIKYALEGSFTEIQTAYQQRNLAKTIRANQGLLNNLSEALNLPKWQLIGDLYDNESTLLLHTTSKNLRFDKETIPRKFVFSALVDIFIKENITIHFFNATTIILPAAKSLAKKLETLIPHLKAEINKCWYEHQEKETFKGQIKKLTNILFKDTQYFYSDTPKNSSTTDYYWMFVTKDLNELSKTIQWLQAIYGKQRIEVTSTDDDTLLKIAAGSACDAIKFESYTTKCPKPLTLPTFSSKEDQSTYESLLTKTHPLKEKQEPIKDESDKKNTAPMIINFGIWGKYDPKELENKIQPIDAPYWPKKKHFMLFNAKRRFFPNVDEHKNFAEARTHMGGKGRGCLGRVMERITKRV